MPILKWKQGELGALDNLSAAARSLTIPMLDIVEDTIDVDTEMLTTPRFQRTANRLAKAWPSGPIFIDADEFDALIGSGVNPLLDLFAAFRAVGAQAVPVSRIGCSPAFSASVAAIIQTDGRGSALRLTTDDLVSPTLALSLGTALAALGVSASNVDLVLDFGIIPNYAATYLAAVSAIPRLPSLQSWRSVVFAGSSFPEDLSAAGTGFSTIARLEWTVYQLLLDNLGNQRPVAFGDYAIAHPVYRPVGFAGAAAIRYAQIAEWLINRGRSVNGPVHGGYGQFRQLSSQLVGHAAFCGTAHCWGDQQITNCAQGVGGTGNNTTWRAVGTNHHLTFVSDQCANHRAPSNGRAPPPVGP